MFIERVYSFDYSSGLKRIFRRGIPQELKARGKVGFAE